MSFLYSFSTSKAECPATVDATVGKTEAPAAELTEQPVTEQTVQTHESDERIDRQLRTFEKINEIKMQHGRFKEIEGRDDFCTKERDDLRAKLLSRTTVFEGEKAKLEQKHEQEKAELEKSLQEARFQNAECELKLVNAEVKLAELEAKEKQFASKTEEVAKSHEQQWTASRVVNANLQSQIEEMAKKELVLVQDNSTLTMRLVEAQTALSETAAAFGNKLKVVKQERDDLREQQKTLVEKLVTFAKALDSMTAEQAEVVNQEIDNEDKTVRAINSQSRLMAEARREQRAVKSLKKKQAALSNSLQRINEDLKRAQKEREHIMMRGVEQCRSIQMAQGGRSSIVESVVDQRAALSALIQEELGSLPESITEKSSDLRDIQEHHKSTFKRVVLKTPAVIEKAPKVAPVQHSEETASSEDEESVRSEYDFGPWLDETAWW